jgi:hypothetical protein
VVEGSLRPGKKKKGVISLDKEKKDVINEKIL